ncbi:WYL domain-containing protein [Cohnella lubricantis]|uniref:WYL domain-containing protein n=1 Tax=Cohnella lubricantis TaxID=2163172 RepID=A0A841TLA7_9BACL|nr:WYL domain-containing protein [Cohnella lubricantis]MBB6679707.1 WYL domain-containing protein [Cohnella lubricantis]MBP2119371.1 putative DNA-binding transcriptional regulator YafY [Cohnella lubricantis]
MRGERLIAILLHLQANGQATARELAERLEVSERTIQRDLEALSASGIPVYAQRGAKGGWVLPAGYRSKLTGMTVGEISSLLLLQSSSVVRDLELESDAGRAMTKLLSALPSDKRAEAEFVRRHLHIDGAGWHAPKQPAPWLPVVQQAVWESRKLRIRYASRSEESAGAAVRLVSPWGLVAKQQTWYFVAALEESEAAEDGGDASRDGARRDVESQAAESRDEERREPPERELRTFRVSRLMDAELTGERFEIPPAFDLAVWWEASTARFKETLPRYPAQVRVRLHAWERFAAERYVRISNWNPEEGDWVIANAQFHTLESARDLLLGYGPDVRAIQPAPLVRSIRQAAADLLKLYEPDNEA